MKMNCEELKKGNDVCPYLKECHIFATYVDSDDKNYMKILNTYCYSDYSKCVRYKLKSNKKKFPVNLVPLLPNGSYIKTTSLRKNLLIGILSILFFVSVVNLGIFHFQLEKFSKEFQNSILQYAMMIKKMN